MHPVAKTRRTKNSARGKLPGFPSDTTPTTTATIHKLMTVWDLGLLPQCQVFASDSSWPLALKFYFSSGKVRILDACVTSSHDIRRRIYGTNSRRRHISPRFFLQISVLYLAFRLRLVSLQNGGVILCSLQQHESYEFIWIRRTCWMFTIACCLVVGLGLGLTKGLDLVCAW